MIKRKITTTTKQKKKEEKKERKGEANAISIVSTSSNASFFTFIIHSCGLLTIIKKSNPQHAIVITVCYNLKICVYCIHTRLPAFDHTVYHMTMDTRDNEIFEPASWLLTFRADCSGVRKRRLLFVLNNFRSSSGSLL